MRYRLLAVSILCFALQANAFADALTSIPKVGSRHILWQIKGRQNTVWLLGSVHFLPKNEQLDPVLIKAYQDSDAIVMEIDMDALDPVKIQTVTMQLAMLPDGQTLAQRLGEQLDSQFIERAKQLGANPELLGHFQPWFAALTITQLQLLKMGLDPESGIEKQLLPLVHTDHRPIQGLETFEEQLGILAGLSDKNQKEFVQYSLEDTESAPKELDAMLSAWRQGDAKQLASVLEEEFKRFPDLYRPLTVQRNQRWVPQIERMLADKRNYLVVVGALHLVGRDSVIDLLQKDGYKAIQQ
jgi:uncharacterized protein YbaP (TraB family)